MIVIPPQLTLTLALLRARFTRRRGLPRATTRRTTETTYQPGPTKPGRARDSLSYRGPLLHTDARTECSDGFIEDGDGEGEGEGEGGGHGDGESACGVRELNSQFHIPLSPREAPVRRELEQVLLWTRSQAIIDSYVRALYPHRMRRIPRMLHAVSIHIHSPYAFPFPLAHTFRD